jgi:hypothetical protein
MAKLAESSGAIREKKGALLRTFWPSPQDYNEAVQNPKQSFSDTELAESSAELDKFGIPRPHTGMFASVYKMQATNATWALRFFLHNVPDQVERYAAIGKQLRKLNLASFVKFDFQETGLQLLGTTFPILKMNWINGEGLIPWLQNNLTQSTRLEAFLLAWTNLMKSLSANGIAHGDLQHGNILIDASGIRVIDYDAMFVPELAGRQSNELGHRNYQHPQRAATHFASYLDNFSAWLIYLSVKMIKLDPGLWWELRGGDDCLLFRAADLENPIESDAFYILEAHPTEEIRNAARLLRYLRSCRIEDVPPLGEEVVVPANFESIVGDASDDDASDGTAYDGTAGDAIGSGGAFVSRSAKRRRSRKKGGAPGGRYFGVRTTLDRSPESRFSAAEIPAVDESAKTEVEEQAPVKKKKSQGDLLDRLRPSQVLVYGASQENLPAVGSQSSPTIAQNSGTNFPVINTNSNESLNVISDTGMGVSSGSTPAFSSLPSKKQFDTAWAAAVITLILVIVIAFFFFWMTKGQELSPLERLTIGITHKPLGSKHSGESLMIHPVDWTRSKR